MDSNNEKKYTFKIEEPSNFSSEELKKFHELVIKGEKIRYLENLETRISNCKLLGFCFEGDKIIAISSIKRPQNSYVERIINNTKIKRKIEDLKYEIGYSVTEEKYRKQGISSEIKRQLIEKMNNVNGIIFSTTAIQSSKNFLIKYGFKNVGLPYDGENDKNIMYFEKNNILKKEEK